MDEEQQQLEHQGHFVSVMEEDGQKAEGRRETRQISLWLLLAYHTLIQTPHNAAMCSLSIICHSSGPAPGFPVNSAGNSTSLFDGVQALNVPATMPITRTFAFYHFAPSETWNRDRLGQRGDWTRTSRARLQC
uniref:Uncharacterized protein n=1 Tax=Eutreptiella gymnastica TaxID=73025 RepID=A0A7S1N0R6_9EUGL|mmetsp:Transcript_101709/g.175616  ORF Transcript_101709/g.175616 Transcript_101709/m.175616 type:complete len:133 (+) Transcript_101709:376-774(+)